MIFIKNSQRKLLSLPVLSLIFALFYLLTCYAYDTTSSLQNSRESKYISNYDIACTPLYGGGLSFSTTVVSPYILDTLHTEIKLEQYVAGQYIEIGSWSKDQENSNLLAFDMTYYGAIERETYRITAIFTVTKGSNEETRTVSSNSTTSYRLN